jgi:hypothetical protein
MMRFTAGFVAGLVLASVGAFAQSVFPDPFQQQQKSWEQQLNEQSIMRDGGIGYQRSFAQPRNPC